MAFNAVYWAGLWALLYNYLMFYLTVYHHFPPDFWYWLHQYLHQAGAF